jgi:hypothetical protein
VKMREVIFDSFIDARIGLVILVVAALLAW